MREIKFPINFQAIRAAALAVATAPLLVFLAPGTAHAIPSPELIVGSLTGLSQLGALLAAMLGGGTAMALRGRRRDGSSRGDLRVPLGLLMAGVLLVAGNVYQWTAWESERSAHLGATLVRPAPRQLDIANGARPRELSFTEQLTHPLALSTADAEVLIPRAKEAGVTILDIRETAEVEAGTFSSARAVRFPDIDAEQLRHETKTVLLLCHNGNRSSETCQALADKGIPCRFIAGGLEKWITEGRSLGGFYRRSLKEVRAIPAYPNQDRLINTREFRDLAASGPNLLVDVRYPGEFATGHLVGAVNIPMRRLTTTDLTRALDALPDRPLVVPCYDRRSCFFGELLGLEWTRRGRTFLGRYTTPWEFFVTPSPPPHVAAFLAEESKSAWAKSAGWLAHAISAEAARSGLLPLIVVLAFLSRLLVSPFSLKAERDQLAARRIAPDITALKARLADDPVRLRRALAELYRAYGMTPLRNQLALLMLPVLALNVEAIGEAARLRPDALLWIADLAQPDPWLILPLTFGVLFAAYIQWTLATTRRHAVVTWCLVTPALTAIGTTLPAAAAIYLATSALLLLAQRAIVVGWPAGVARNIRARFVKRSWSVDGVLTLAEAAKRPDTGNKAHRLGVMAAAGIPVPDGVVLTTDALHAWAASTASERTERAREVWLKVDANQVAVRSSADGEDGAFDSFAGVFESALDVEEAGLTAAIDQVLASFNARRGASYGIVGGANILVQRMVAAQFAGVLFTRAPDASGLALVELVHGTADGLVSGRVTPCNYRFGRVSSTQVEGGIPPIDLAPLLQLGRRIEALFRAPQDIEWTWRHGRFYIVQARDVTAVANADDPRIEAEWCRVLGLASAATADEPVLARNELSEMLPRPTPMSLSLLHALHASGGSADLACRALGLAYRVGELSPQLHVAVFGRLHVDLREARRRAPQLSRLDARRIARQLPEFERAFAEDFVPAFKAEMAILDAVDFDRLTTQDLMGKALDLHTSFVTRTHVEAEIINIAAEIVCNDVRRVAGAVCANLLTPDRSTAVQQALVQAWALDGEARRAFLVCAVGHRGRLDYELAAARYAEEPASLDALLATVPDVTRPPDGTIGLDAATLSKPERVAVDQARRLLTLKEDAKHLVLRELAVLRRVLLAIDRRFELRGFVFYLECDEVLGLSPETRDHLLQRATERSNARDALAVVPSLHSPLSLAMLERATWADGAGTKRASGALGGKRVAGRRIVEGRAFVVPDAIAETGATLDGFADGDIIVASMIHPAWLPEVLRSGGVVSEAGGFLSHMAIVARERDIAMIVGVGGWRRIEQGAGVSLQLDGRIEIVAEDVGVQSIAIAAE